MDDVFIETVLWGIVVGHKMHIASMHIVIALGHKRPITNRNSLNLHRPREFTKIHAIKFSV